MNIYQVLPRLFGNTISNNKPNGSIEENGCGKLNNFTPKALQSIKKLGITHIWYTGVIEHATKTDYTAFGIAKDHEGIVKGQAGSAYAIKDYYDIDPDLAVNIPNRMQEFEELIARTQKAELKAIIDFVPNHVAREYKSDAKPKGVKDLGANDNTEWEFSPENNFYYIHNQAFCPQFDSKGYEEYPAKATGNDQFHAYPSINDWYETVKLNYGVNYVAGQQKHFDPIPSTWLKMRDILLFWSKKKVDGFRCDMAEMVPVEFWGWVIPEVKKKFPNIIFIAEVYNPNEYRNYIFNGKFDYLYDKVGMYEVVRRLACEQESAASITGTWQAVNDIQPHMLNFMENHDEQRIASDFFAIQAENAIPSMLFLASYSSSPLMIYSGQELGEKGMDTEGFSGQDGRTTIFDYWSVDSLRRWYNDGKLNQEQLTEEEIKLQEFYKTILTLREKEPALSQGEFFDLMWVNYDNPDFNEHQQFAFFRKHEDELLLVVINFDSKAQNIAIKIPEIAFEHLNIIPDKKYKCTDLLSKKKSTQMLSPSEAFKVELPANYGLMIKLQ